MRQIHDEPVHPSPFESILPKAALHILPLRTPDAPPINIGPHRHGPKMRARNRKAPRPDERVVEQLSRRGARQVGRHERELRVHGRGADVLPRLQAKLDDGIPIARRDPAAQMHGQRLRGAVDRKVLEDVERLFGIAHLDEALEAEVVKALDDSACFGGGAAALEVVEGELEGAGAVEGPLGGGPTFDVGVEGLVRGSAAPELKDAFA